MKRDRFISMMVCSVVLLLAVACSSVGENKVDIGSERDYIFFLATYVNTPANLLNPIQGLYVYEPRSLSEDMSDRVKITGAHPDNNLILKLEDLNKIKSEYH